MNDQARNHVNETEKRLDSESLETLVDLAKGKKRIGVFTGAGISTESGIPDYRGPAGVWATQKPPTLGDFLTNPETRRTYWTNRRERYPDLASRQPNAGHLAIARLFGAGLVSAIVTQNIDGLHQDAGIPDDDVIELHGSARVVRCTQCGRSWSGDRIQERQDAGELVPDCEVCGGILRTSTVLFGEALPDGVLERAVDVARTCDLMLAIGSSLVVQPAAKVPLIALRSGKPLVIINYEATPLDDLATLVVRESAGATLTALAEALLPQI